MLTVRLIGIARPERQNTLKKLASLRVAERELDVPGDGNACLVPPIGPFVDPGVELSIERFATDAHTYLTRNRLPWKRLFHGLFYGFIHGSAWM